MSVAPLDSTVIPSNLVTKSERVDQAAIFRRLKYRIALNSFHDLLQTGRLRLITILVTSLLVALFVFGLSWYGFDQMFRTRLPVKGLIVGGLFDLMFFTLGCMLVFSTGIIMYASLFTSPESRYLLATPARADVVFMTKFHTAIAFSSWAFLILGMPILVSYGLVAGVPIYFYPLLPAVLLGFILLPGSLSAIGCLVLVRYFPRTRWQVVALAVTILILLSGAWFYRVVVTAKSSLDASRARTNEIDSLVSQFALAQSPITPSHWVTECVMGAARDEWSAAVLPIAKLWSNGLLAYLCAAWTARRIYRTAFDRAMGAGRGKRIYRGNVLDSLMEWLVFYLDKPTRILIVKDFRTFRRDPTQWVLLVVFAGLMALGAMNFRQYYRADLAGIERYIISLVNLAGTSVLLCAGLSRFIFPLISLEGRKFWVLGLMPISREQILIGKFAFAATGSVLIAEVLILGSDLLLGVPTSALLAHGLTGLVVAVGLSGLNVGLGAYMPNFKETDPSKIVVGFGGTVNMVLGLLFLTITLSLMAAPLYVAVLIRKYGQKTDGAGIPLWAFAGIPIGLLLGLIVAVIPLRAGAKALRKTEF